MRGTHLVKGAMLDLGKGQLRAGHKMFVRGTQVN
jgi:hypothetical protein